MKKPPINKNSSKYEYNLLYNSLPLEYRFLYAIYDRAIKDYALNVSMRKEVEKFIYTNPYGLPENLHNCIKYYFNKIKKEIIENEKTAK